MKAEMGWKIVRIERRKLILIPRSTGMLIGTDVVAVPDDHSGSGINSESRGTGANRPLFQSDLACSMRSRELETKFHQT